MRFPLARHALAAVLAVAIGGCAADLFPFLPGSKPAPTSTFKARLGSLEFRSVTAETSKKLEALGSAFGSPGGSTSKDAASQEAAAPSSASDGATGTDDAPTSTDAISSGMPISIYGYSSYFSGPFGPMKLESVTEATAAGLSGGLEAVLAGVVDPVIADWAPDARMIYSNVTLDADGEPARGTESFPGEFGWRIAYSAPSLGEALYFLIGADKTTVVRLRWVPVAIDRKAVAVSARSAVDRVRAGIKDPAFKSEEQRLGKDGYFFADDSNALPATAESGGSSAGVAKAEAGVATPEKPDAEPERERYTWEVKTEELYELQPGGNWSANLQVIGKYTVWELFYNGGASRGEIMPLPAPAIGAAEPADAVTTDKATQTETEPEPRTYTNPGAYALVDARTGDVLRLRRPTRTTVTPIKL